jgi:mannose-1-phosphate guanylyltransferase
MNAMLLAAGRGTRLGEASKTVPKALVDIGGRPLLERQLEYLADQGAERIAINAHHLGHLIEAFVDGYRRRRPGAPAITVVREERLLGTAGGVRNALPNLGADPILVLYADVIVDEPLGPVLNAHRARGPDATLCCYWADSSEGKGVVTVDDSLRAVGFEEKPADGSAPGMINSGLAIVEPRLVEPLPPGEERDFGHDVFPAAIRAGARIDAYLLTRPVKDIGTPEVLEEVRMSFAFPTTGAGDE